MISHPVGLASVVSGCGALPDAELVSAWDTAGSAEIVAQEKNPALPQSPRDRPPDAHGLVPLAERIEDDSYQQPGS